MTTLREKTAITGVGETKYSRNSGTTALALQLEASLNAIADAGLSVRRSVQNYPIDQSLGDAG